MDGPVTLRLLGGVELLGPDGLPARAILAQPRRLALLVYLASTNGSALHRKDSVRALFWPDSDDRRARQALNRAIYVLRQVLGAGVLMTRGDDEIGAGEALECDVIRFGRAMVEGAPASALDLYRGDLAPGFFVSGLPEFERWMEIERARLREQAVAAAMKLAAGEDARGRLDFAEGWARRAELLAPHDERAAAYRIDLLDWMGDRAAALRAFEELERRLRTDLEVDPSPETSALVKAMRERRDSRARITPATAREDRAGARGEVVSSSLTLATPAPAGGLRRLVLIGMGALAFVGAVSALLARARTRVLTTSHAVPVTSELGLEIQPALSPDGSLVAFMTVTGERDVVAVRSAAGTPAGGEIRPAPTTSGDEMFPVWTADGERLRYVSVSRQEAAREPFHRPVDGRSYTWMEVPRLGGPTLPVGIPRGTQWVAWSRDGTRAAFAVAESLFVVDSGSRLPRFVAAHPGAWGPHSLAWSPDGRWIAYVNGNAFWPTGWNTSSSELWLVGVDRGDRVQVTHDTYLNASPAWLDPDHLMFVSDRDGQREVYVVEIGRNGPRGKAVKVPGTTDAHSISLSADGKRLALAKLIARQHVRSFPLNGRRPFNGREGRLETSGSQVVETHDVSPDGRWLAYDTNLHGDADIYAMPLDGGSPVPIVTGPRQAFSPRWSPDRREIAYYGGEHGDIWVVPADGGTPTQLTSTAAGEELPIWSPDGLSLVYRAGHAGRPEAWIVSRERVGGLWSAPRRLTDFGCAYQLWVRNGTGVLCGWPRSTVLTLVSPTGAVLWRRDFAASGLSGFGPPTLSPDGTTLYLGATRGSEAGIWSLPLGGGPPREVVSFTDRSIVVHSYPGTINVTRDRLYLTVGEFESDIWVMDLVWR